MKVEKLEFGYMSNTKKLPIVSEKPVLLFAYRKGEGNADGRFPIMFGIFHDSAVVENKRFRSGEQLPQNILCAYTMLAENYTSPRGLLKYRERKIVFCRSQEEASEKAATAAERFTQNNKEKNARIKIQTRSR